MEQDTHSFFIKCKSCNEKWMIQIPITHTNIEAFAGICDCGAIIVGNYNYEYHKHLEFSDELDKDVIKKIYLTNGHFRIILQNHQEIDKIRKLDLAI